MESEPINLCGEVVIATTKEFTETMTTYHIEYVVHVYVDANDEDEARELGTQYLEKADEMDSLVNACEFIAIEAEEGE